MDVSSALAWYTLQTGLARAAPRRDATIPSGFLSESVPRAANEFLWQDVKSGSFFKSGWRVVKSGWFEPSGVACLLLLLYYSQIYKTVITTNYAPFTLDGKRAPLQTS